MDTSEKMMKILFIVLALSIFLCGTAFVLIKAPSAINLPQDGKKKEKRKDGEKKREDGKKQDGDKDEDKKSSSDKKGNGDKKPDSEKKTAPAFAYDSNVNVLQTWTMPPALLEISGMV